MSSGAAIPSGDRPVRRLLLKALSVFVGVAFMIVFLLDSLGPWVYKPVLAAPLLIAALIWWLRGRSKGEPGKSLPTFLLGYLILFTSAGVGDDLNRWSHRHSLSDYVSWVAGTTLIAYLFGGIGFLVLADMKQSVVKLFSWWLAESSDSNQQPEDFSEKRVSGSGAAALDARQRAIEECAEVAYDYFIDNEVPRAADYDRAESGAARLRDAILALGASAS